MRYNNIVKGSFISRPHRFEAYVRIGEGIKLCHVKNTGRCKELLTDGATVLLEHSDNPKRKTEYDLVAVYKGRELINMDSMAPNRVFKEWAQQGCFVDGITKIKPECTYNNSRFDFYIEAGQRRIFVEVKGVTLEKDGIVLFPDAPTTRGVKHINELADAVGSGYEAYVFFIVQMKNCKYFTPNKSTHKEFADALKLAQDRGVQLRCVNCNVTEDELDILDYVEIVL